MGALSGASPRLYRPYRGCPLQGRTGRSLILDPRRRREERPVAV